MAGESQVPDSQTSAESKTSEAQTRRRPYWATLVTRLNQDTPTNLYALLAMHQGGHVALRFPKRYSRQLLIRTILPFRYTCMERSAVH